MLRVRFQCPTGESLGFSVERLSDGLLFDFADAMFKQTPTTLIMNLPENTGPFTGRYDATFGPTAKDQFTDGAYAVTVHDLKANNAVVAQLSTVFKDDDDAPAFGVTAADLAAFVQAVETAAAQIEDKVAEVKKLAGFKSGL